MEKTAAEMCVGEHGSQFLEHLHGFEERKITFAPILIHGREELVRRAMPLSRIQARLLW